MPRLLLAPLSAALLLLQPLPTAAQTSSANGRATAAQAGGDCALAPACPRLNATNHWGAYQVIGLNPRGTVSPRNNVGLQIVGPGPGENNVVDAFSYNGTSQYVAERYNTIGSKFTPVLKGENIGGYLGAAFDGAGDPADAGLMFLATENQTPTANGVDAEIYYTPNGSTALTQGLAVSRGGLGGVTVGRVDHSGQGPADLGNGTVNAADSIVTGNHFRTMGDHGSISACGATPNFAGGTDQAGMIVTGGEVKSCTYNFARTWSAPPICMVQVFRAATPTPFITNQLATSITVSFSAPFNGTFQFMCMGIG